jgi:hypothetical protein
MIGHQVGVAQIEVGVDGGRGHDGEPPCSTTLRPGDRRL